MKKMLAFTLSLTILIVSLSCGLVLNTAAKEYSPSTLFWDFSTQESFSALTAYGTSSYVTGGPRCVINANNGTLGSNKFSKASYDAAAGAMKLLPGTGGAVQLDVQDLSGRVGVDITKYHTIAFKVRYENAADANFNTVTMRVNDGAAASPANIAGNLHNMVKPTFAKTDEWQLVIGDLSQSKWIAGDSGTSDDLATIQANNVAAGTTSNWWGGRYVLAGAAAGAVYVQWAGVFENEEAARGYYEGKTAPEEPEEPEEPTEPEEPEEPEEPGEDPASYRTVFYYDFTTELLSYASGSTWVSPDRWCVNGHMFGGSDDTTAAVGYDAKASALKVTGNGTNMVDLDVRGFDRRHGVVANDNKVLALKVKLSDTDAVLQSASMGLHDGSAAATCTTMYDLKKVPAYKKTTDWQLVLIDLSSANWSQGLTDIQNVASGTPNDWWAAHINLAQAGYKSPINVAWVGAFKDTETAQKYYDLTAGGTAGEDDDDEPTEPSYYESENDTAFLFDFTTKANYTDMTNYRYPSTDTTNPRTMVNFKSAPLDLTDYGAVSYNSARGALKLVPDGVHAPMLDLRCLDWRKDLDITKYGTLAVKIQLGDRETVLQNVQMLVNDGGVSNANALIELPNVPAYARTTDWQLLLIDLTSANYDRTLKTLTEKNAADGTASNWWGTCLTLGDVDTAEPIYVAWAGIFENPGRALAYYAETTEKTATDWLFDFSSQEKYDDITDFGVNGNMERPRTLVNENNAAADTKYSSIAFDTVNNAIKVKSNRGAMAQLDLQCLDWRPALDYKNHTALAMKVKLSDTNASLRNVNVFVNDGAAASSANSAHELSAIPEYEKTTDWQLVVIDIDRRNWEQSLKSIETLNEGAGTSSVFWRTRVGLAQAGYTGEVSVEWIGYFSSESNAIAHYLKTTEGVDLTKVKLSVNQTPKPKHTKFFYDFSNEGVYQENFDNARVGVNYDTDSTVSFDGEEQALKLIGGSASAPYLELLSNDRTYDINAGHVLAVKMKITSPNSAYQGTKMYAKDDASVDPTIGGNDSIDDPGKSKTLRSDPQYKNAVGWQLLLVDLSDANRFEDLADKTGVWYGTRLGLGASGTTDPFYVSWAGIFDTAEAAQAYFDYTTPENNEATFEEEYNPDAVEAPTPLFWDFTTKSSVNQVESKGDTVLDFDVDLRAMKITAQDTNRDDAVGLTPGDISFGTKKAIESGISMEDYPIFAMRVKLDKRDTTGGMMSVISSASRENQADGMIDSALMDVDTLNYRETTNWQTVVIDYRDNLTAFFFLGGDWVSIDAKMFNENQVMDGDTLYVRWAGAFANMDDLKAYLEATAPFETGNDDVDDPGDPWNDIDDPDVDDPNGGDEDDPDSPETGVATDVTVALLLTAAAAAVLTAFRKRRVSENGI